MTIFDEFRQQNFVETAKKTAEDCRFLLYKTSIKNFLFVKSALLIYNHKKRCGMEKRDLALNRKILEYLVTIGIQPKLSGFEYLRLAIKLVMQNKNYLTNITKMLYPEIVQAGRGRKNEAVHLDPAYLVHARHDRPLPLNKAMRPPDRL